MRDAGFVEAPPTGDEAERLVERHGLYLGMQHEHLLPTPPRNLHQLTNDRRPYALTTRLRQDGHAADLRVAAILEQPPGTDCLVAQHGEHVGGCLVGGVELLLARNSLLFVEHAQTDLKGGRPIAFAAHDVNA